eukprot:gnl/MRDRNA2_/MRDRNA2_147863_c0_seq1.p1 gnl/MRDRNA2_/MRDRNA2_147863_c0~~gnl/MRDRNA2_/MRDRNA2_147863_c0_seq1.p1  ORF type:complete len:240 (+),score=32.87 gnl/MRDRNA2_/MRDRNA2_147863_c0_seq1:97-720(+)
MLRAVRNFRAEREEPPGLADALRAITDIRKHVRDVLIQLSGSGQNPSDISPRSSPKVPRAKSSPCPSSSGLDQHAQVAQAERRANEAPALPRVKSSPAQFEASSTLEKHDQVTHVGTDSQTLRLLEALSTRLELLATSVDRNHQECMKRFDQLGETSESRERNQGVASSEGNQLGQIIGARSHNIDVPVPVEQEVRTLTVSRSGVSL